MRRLNALLALLIPLATLAGQTYNDPLQNILQDVINAHRLRNEKNHSRAMEDLMRAQAEAVRAQTEQLRAQNQAPQPIGGVSEKTQQ